MSDGCIRSPQAPRGSAVGPAWLGHRPRRHFRLRKKVVGSAERPRLVVTRSLAAPVRAGRRRLEGRHACVGLDDGSRPADGDKTAQAKQIGAQLAERAKAAGVGQVVFDRGGNTYTGRVAAFADAAREAGLEF